MSDNLERVASIHLDSEHGYVHFAEQLEWLLVANNSKSSPLQIYGYDGSMIGSLGKGQIVENAIISFDSRREWILSNKGNNLLMLDKSGKEADFQWLSDYEALSGISYQPATGLYLLTDLKHHCVLCFDPRSKAVVRTIGSYGRHSQNFNCPVILCSDKIGNSSLMCVSDGKNNQVKLFTTDGELVEVFGHRSGGSGRGEMCRPLGVCMDSKRRLIVCDQLNKRVVRLPTDKTQKECYSSCNSTADSFKKIHDSNDINGQFTNAPDTISENSDTDSCDLFERCPTSAFENGPLEVEVDEASLSKDSFSSFEDEEQEVVSETGASDWECLLPAEAFASGFDSLGIYGTKYTSSVDVTSSGILAVTLYEDCDEKTALLNIYKGYQ